MFRKAINAVTFGKVVSTQLYRGQGLGNQLWVYAVTRVAALRLGGRHRIEGRWRFKGATFLRVDFGIRGLYFPTSGPKKRNLSIFTTRLIEEKTFHKSYNLDLSKYQQIESNTKRLKLEGNFESEKYLIPFESLIRQELQTTRRIHVPKNLCLINVRGGDFKGNAQVLLDSRYYYKAVSEMRKIFQDVRFAIITDDIEYAKSILPGYPILSRETQMDSDFDKIEHDFSLLQQAHKLIIGNSSFGWWAAWTNPNKPFVLAPRLWAGHNSECERWSPGSILTSGWNWLGQNGGIRSSQEEEAILSMSLSDVHQEQFLVHTRDWIPRSTQHRFRNFLYKHIKSLGLID